MTTLLAHNRRHHSQPYLHYQAHPQQEQLPLLLRSPIFYTTTIQNTKDNNNISNHDEGSNSYDDDEDDDNDFCSSTLSTPYHQQTFVSIAHEDDSSALDRCSLPFIDYSQHNFTPLSISGPSPMQSAHQAGSWNFAVSNGQLTPTSARTPRNSYHNRESSLSSIGSAGPSSPYNGSTSNPQIILPADIGEVYYDGLPPVEGYHSFTKPLTPITPLHDFNYGYHDYSPASTLATFMAMQKQHSGEASMPAPEYARQSVARNESTENSSPSDEYKNAPSVPKLDRTVSDLYGAATIPKLDRTMSDIYNDELYSPSFAFTSAPTSRPGSSTAPPLQNDVFSQRLQAANSQHLSAPSQAPQTTNSRRTSPFRQGSPLAPVSDGFGPQQLRISSAQSIRENQKAQSDALALVQQIKRSSPQNQTEEKTISPKDALLDFNEPVDSESVPLFPQSTHFTPMNGSRQLKQEPSMISDLDDSASQQSFASMATSRRESSSTYSTTSQSIPPSGSFAFAPSNVPGAIKVPQQYPFVPAPRREQSSLSAATPDFPSTLTSMESSSSEYTPDLSIQKPAGTTADGGTYTCTYHGCTLRFETPTKLQKHKREGHRQSAPLLGGTSPARASESPESGNGMTSAGLNRSSQAGPHKCERINPSTGKPCNTIFSRPYDLTRHEDTIHNARKQKVRCHLCTEEKTFSRNDALTRHMRVVHPEVDFPGKTRRRGHD